MENNGSYIDTYLSEVHRITKDISKESISKSIDILFDAWQKDRKIFVIGNGGSASTATHFACDLSKYTAIKGKKRVKALSLEDNVPLLTALVNDEGWDDIYSFQLENLLGDGDCIVAISVHGGTGKDKAAIWSQNLLKAVDMVKRKGGKAIGLIGFDGGVLAKMVDASVIVPAQSTPQVEGFHLVITHLICDRLREKIAAS